MNFKYRILTALENFIKKVNQNTAKSLIEIRKYKYFMGFEEREADIYVTTFLKSGTTWMQMILYQMVGKGGADFDHIYDVAPWVHNEAYLGKSPERVNKLPSPRIIKSHDPYERFDKNVKGRFIFVYRNGQDVAVSLYYHIQSYENPDVTFDENFDKYFKAGEYNWFSFTKQWLKNEHDFPILYISYEALKNDFEGTVRRIADFLEVTLTPEILDNIATYTTFEYMKQHETKFGERPQKMDRRRFDQFIRKGSLGEGKKYLNDEQLKAYEEKFSFLRGFLKKHELI